MTELKDLKVGDEVTVTLTGVIYEKVGNDRAYFGREDAPSDWIVIDSDDKAVFELAPRPLPTEPGVYVPGNNASIAHYSYLYRLGEEEDWSRISDGEEEDITESVARKAHENLGGLVRLVPEQ